MVTASPPCSPPSSSSFSSAVRQLPWLHFVLIRLSHCSVTSFTWYSPAASTRFFLILLCCNPHDQQEVLWEGSFIWKVTQSFSPQLFLCAKAFQRMNLAQDWQTLKLCVCQRERKSEQMCLFFSYLGWIINPIVKYAKLTCNKRSFRIKSIIAEAVST